MTEFVNVKGYCPVVEKTQTITVTFLSAAHFGAPDHWVQGTIRCDYAAFNDCPYSNKCPVLENGLPDF